MLLRIDELESQNKLLKQQLSQWDERNVQLSSQVEKLSNDVKQKEEEMNRLKFKFEADLQVLGVSDVDALSTIDVKNKLIEDLKNQIQDLKIRHSAQVQELKAELNQA